MIYKINKQVILENGPSDFMKDKAYAKYRAQQQSGVNKSDEETKLDTDRKAQSETAQQDDQFHKENPTVEDHTTQYPGYE